MTRTYFNGAGFENGDIYSHELRHSLSLKLERQQFDFSPHLGSFQIFTPRTYKIILLLSYVTKSMVIFYSNNSKNGDLSKIKVCVSVCITRR